MVEYTSPDYSYASLLNPFRDEAEKLSEKYKNFLAFAFILATNNDKEVLCDFLYNSYEIHKLTEGKIVIFAPKIVQNSDGYLVNLLKDKFERLFFIRHSTENENSNKIEYLKEEDIKKYIDKYTNETYSFIEFIEKSSEQSSNPEKFSRKKLPCILFFDNLEKPQDKDIEFVLWKIEKDSKITIVEYFREVIDALNKEESRYNMNPLDEILELNKKIKRNIFISKHGEKIFKLLPFLKSLPIN